MKINRISAATAGLLSTSIVAGMANSKDEKSKISQRINMTFLNKNQMCEALVQDEDRKRLHEINTNLYVWGEGFQVDPTQDYSNFTPKKIQQFKGKETPNIVDVAFGWYHEAYIDQKG